MARTVGSSGAQTSEDVRKAALALFAAEGYAAVSMRQIATAVGIQAGAIYNHFPNKQSILFELMHGHMTALLETWEAVEQALQTPQDALEAFVRFHIRFHAGREDDVFISYMELRNLEPENFAQVEALRKRYEQVLQSIIERGVKDKTFSAKDPPITAMAIIAMLTGVTTWYREGGRLSLAEIETIYTDMAKRSVGMAA